MIIEEYAPVVLNKAAIREDDDVIKNLRLFDLANNKTGRFSKLTGGSFSIKALNENKLIYCKRYPDKTAEFETDLSKVPVREINLE